MKAKSGMQHSIIAGILLRSVSMKSFARSPPSPIFSFTCFSSHRPNADLVWPGAPVLKWNDDFGAGVTLMGGIDGTLMGGIDGRGGPVADKSGGGGATGGVTFVSASGILASGILGMRAIIVAIFARSSALRLFRTSDVMYALNACLTAARSGVVGARDASDNFTRASPTGARCWPVRVEWGWTHSERLRRARCDPAPS